MIELLRCSDSAAKGKVSPPLGFMVFVSVCESGETSSRDGKQKRRTDDAGRGEGGSYLAEEWRGHCMY